MSIKMMKVARNQELPRVANDMNTNMFGIGRFDFVDDLPRCVCQAHHTCPFSQLLKVDIVKV